MSTIVVIMLCFVVIVMFTRRTVRIRKAKIAIIFFSRHIFVYLNKSTKREQNEMNLRRHRNKNTAHFRSQYSFICISCRQKKCLHCVCSLMCLFSSSAVCEAKSQCLHMFDAFLRNNFRWTLVTCFLISVFLLQMYAHWSHIWDLSSDFKCTHFTCFLSSPESKETCAHSLHLKIFSLVCTLLMWYFRDVELPDL